jgi:hypothetical protein
VSQRYFYFWCARCPTRVTVETEVLPSSTYSDPEYAGAVDGVASYQARQPTTNDDGMEIADLCPACGGQLWELGDVSPNNRTADAHAEWRRKVGEP